MLFGSEQTQREIRRVISKVEQEQNIVIIYGATIGSAGRGLQHPGSDIDIYPELFTTF